jgi:hypothetical protein
MFNIELLEDLAGGFRLDYANRPRRRCCLCRDGSRGWEGREREDIGAFVANR